jgi:metal-responsive CopG/Arc/MetJ family transcriptional regulator
MKEKGKKPEADFIVFSIRVKKKLLVELEKLAKKENRNRNNMIECLLEMALKEKKQ